VHDLWRRLSFQVLRGLSRVLAPDLKVRTAADLDQIRGQLRLFGVFALTIMLPGLLLAWVGVSSIQGEELALWDEVERRAELAAVTMSSSAWSWPAQKS